MVIVNPKFITDVHGNKVSVILPLEEFNALIEELEDLEDIRLYDEAKSNNEGEGIPFTEYLLKRNVGDV